MYVRAAFKMVLLTWMVLLCITISDIRCKSFVLRGGAASTVLRKSAKYGDTSVQEASKPDIYGFSITSNIAYRYAVTTVSSRMANPANTSKELSFSVTLPDSAFISRFLMVINDKVYEAYVKEKEQAKRDYQAAVRRGETAGHVEMSSRDSKLFTVSINVESHNKVTFNLTYEQLLTRTLGLYENLINVDPGQIVKSFEVAVNIEESAPIVTLEVPNFKLSNEIDATNSKNIQVHTERPTKNTARIRWAPDEKEQKEMFENGVRGQFILRYEIDRSVNSNQILVDEGYFVHFFAPTSLKTLNKHILFVLDVSGSMAGRSIEQLKQALNLILSDIGDGDSFTLIIFSTHVEVWTLNGLVQVTSVAEMNERFIIPASKENIAKAKTFADSLRDRGSTNIIAALRKSLQVATWGQRVRALKEKPIIIFLTDGDPTDEVTDTNKIVEIVNQLNVDEYPIFSLALGEGADYEFLRKLSLSNSGIARRIYVASDTSLQLKNFYNEVASPLLSNVSFAYIPGQVAENTLTKSSFKNLYSGSELIVAGKLGPIPNELSGNLTAIAYDGEFYAIMPPRISLNRTSGHLEKMWAYLYIKELLDKDLLSDTKNSSYKQQALKLSLQYGFVTPLTSLVVVKPNETSNADTQSVRGDDRSPAYLHPPSFPNKHVISLLTSGGSAGRQSFISGSTASRLDADMDDYNRISFNFADPLIYSGRPVYPSTFVSHSTSSRKTSRPSIVTSTAAPNRSVNSKNVTEALNISSISWIHSASAGNISYSSSNNSYEIASEKEPDVEFQTCTVPNSNGTVSHCRHLRYCVIPEIANSFQNFLPYGEICVIEARFVGICCPLSYASRRN